MGWWPRRGMENWQDGISLNKEDQSRGESRWASRGNSLCKRVGRSTPLHKIKDKDALYSIFRKMIEERDSLFLSPGLILAFCMGKNFLGHRLTSWVMTSLELSSFFFMMTINVLVPAVLWPSASTPPKKYLSSCPDLTGQVLGFIWLARIRAACFCILPLCTFCCSFARKKTSSLISVVCSGPTEGLSLRFWPLFSRSPFW